ncbi:DUF4241 domain-containing protein [Microcoleus sp. BR0-C5]|uniref:DUF4241 domain-containing protein n=1 Tax=Microcoleus sp. BR0-C5 TaxID=2818713 RepID=UPI002FD21696
MSLKAHTNFLAAFEPNQVYESLTEGRITSDVFQAGDLVLPSGRIIACDPGWLWCKDVDPFSRTVPPGRYPVLLSVVDSGRTACAMVKFCSESPVRWEMALRPSEDLAELRGNQFFGYGVDAGMGCFVDAQVIERRSAEELQGLVDRAFEQKLQLDAWLAAQDLVTQLTYPSQQIIDPSGFNLTLDPDTDTFNLTLDPDTEGNASAFSSGYGDGSYASYWGFTADDELACLVTDFGVLLEGITQDIEIEAVTRFLEKSIEHPDLERLEVAIRLSLHRPSWVQLSDDSLNDQPSNPDCILVLEGQGRQPWSVNLDAGDRCFAELCMFSGSIEEDRWYKEHWFNEPLPANAVLKMTFTAEVYPLQPVTTNA